MQENMNRLPIYFSDFLRMNRIFEILKSGKWFFVKNKMIFERLS